MVRKIISGGQTGVDRAALDFGLEKKLLIGGWCPQGKTAEDGVIPDKYPLTETNSLENEERTIRNVLDADGSLIITEKEAVGGTALTVETAYEMGKPFYLLNLTRGFYPEEIRKWLEDNRIRTLNVAGPRASEQEEIYSKTLEILSVLLVPEEV